MEFLKHTQLTLMLFFSGGCCVLAILSFFTNALPKKRRWILVGLQMGASILLLMDRYAYLYRGNTSNLGWWVVRISNFSVFFLSLVLIFLFNLYLMDMCKNDSALSKVPMRLYVSSGLIACGVVMLLVSQFTLLGDARRGRRPSFIWAARPELAEPLFLRLKSLLEETGLTVETGRFRTHMQVELVNDGPVTILLDSRKEF